MRCLTPSQYQQSPRDAIAGGQSCHVRFTCANKILSFLTVLTKFPSKLLESSSILYIHTGKYLFSRGGFKFIRTMTNKKNGGAQSVCLSQILFLMETDVRKAARTRIRRKGQELYGPLGLSTSSRRDKWAPPYKPFPTETPGKFYHTSNGTTSEYFARRPSTGFEAIHSTPSSA